MPHHDTVIQPGDRVIVFIPRKKMVRQVEKLFQVSADQRKSQRHQHRQRKQHQHTAQHGEDGREVFHRSTGVTSGRFRKTSR
jgi:NhaP-type Na+/H+ and K+/H+ antiporter